MKTRKIKIIFGVIFGFTINIKKSFATSIVNTSSGKYDYGDYELNDLLQLGVTASEFILGIVGSLALLMFIYGGLMMLISAGNSEKVTKAKNIVIAAVVGLLIVFASYIIIQFVMSSLGINWKGDLSPITTNTPQTASP